MSSEEMRVDSQPLQMFMADVFAAAGMPRADAELEAEVLVWANLRGVDSHGVLRVEWYLDNIDKGYMNPLPNIQVVKETPAVIYLEADRAFGPVVTVQAMNAAIEKARTVGIGWAQIRNLTHQGALGYYATLAAQQDMIGIAIVCSPPNMAPFGSRAAGVHNSPIAIGVPARRHQPLVLDMATSVAAGGKLDLARDKRGTLPQGWALDAAGQPTTDPFQAEILLPAGGPKGSGLALMFQTLTSQLVANPLVTPLLSGQPNTHGQNSVVAVIDIGLFTDLEEYKTGIDDLIDHLKALPPADGFDGVLMPGEPEFNTLAERSRQGIPLPTGTVEKLRVAARRFGLEMPAVHGN